MTDTYKELADRLATDKLRTIQGLGTKAVNEVIDRCADVGI